MTLPASGAISMGQVDTELGYSATAAISLDDATVRTLAGVGGSGTTISLDNLHGKTALHRPSSYSVGSDTNGYATTPENAYDSSTSTAATVGHNAGGFLHPYLGSETITYSGFGSGSFTGYMYMICDGYLVDSGGGEISSVGMTINSTAAGEVDSTGTTPLTFSFPSSSPFTSYVSGINLATLTVTIWAFGGNDGTASCSGHLTVNDLYMQ